MIDWLTSKLAMMVAAVILFASIAGLFAYQRSAAGISELQGEADAIARAVNGVSAVSGNTVLPVTYDSSRDGFHIKPTVRGDSYALTLNPTFVLVGQKGDRVVSNFASAIHLWKPLKSRYNVTELSNADSSHTALSFPSGQDFKVERRMVDVGGENRYLTFAYP